MLLKNKTNKTAFREIGGFFVPLFEIFITKDSFKINFLLLSLALKVIIFFTSEPQIK